jgi:hypothetical protein
VKAGTAVRRIAAVRKGGRERMEHHYSRGEGGLGSADLNKRFDEWQFVLFLQSAAEPHIRDVVERMREAFTPADELVGSRRILGEQSP